MSKVRDEDKLGVAVVKEACRICGKSYDGPLILNTRLSVPMADKVKALHGKTVGFMKEPCDECKEFMKQGIIVVGIDESKTDDKSNPWRTGNFWVMKEEAIKRMLKDDVEDFRADVLKKRVMFIDIKIAAQMGFPDAKP